MQTIKDMGSWQSMRIYMEIWKHRLEYESDRTINRTLLQRPLVLLLLKRVIQCS
jgi:hypothetical protein